MSDFTDALAERILVCDGAMGTALHAAGNSLDQALPALNLAAADLVGAIHDGYIDAGVDVVQTNTFGASRLRLGPSGYGDRVAEINAAGVRIARAAAAHSSRRVYVAGSVSPAVTVQQRSTISAAERTWALREQIVALDGAGVDLLVLETFGFLTELVEAVTVAAEHSSAPIVAQATFVSDGRTLSGHTPREVAEALAGYPVRAIGINCTLGPQGSLEVATELARHTDRTLSVQPNAGLPRRVSAERLEYEVDPEYFARYAERLVASGVRLIGGCCGTTPLHIGAVVKVVQARQQQITRPTLEAVRHREPAPRPAPRGWLDGTGPVVGAELVPPATGHLQEALEAAEAVRDSGATVFSIATPAPGRAQRTAMNQSVDLAAKLQDRLDAPAVPAVTTWNRTIMALQAHLLGAQARGVSRIVCETGNPPLMGDYPTVDGKWEVDSIGLIELLSALNAGVDYNGLRISSGVTFEIGARFNPGAHDTEQERDRVRRKVAAGAQFLLTRPVYETAGLTRVLEAVDGAVPVLATIRPLRSFDEAEYLRYEVPDVTIPAAVMDRMERAGASGARVGLDIAAELAAEVGHLVRGVVVGAPGTGPDQLAELIRALVGITPGGAVLPP
jgi:methionine synthase / methylenetetrahydrofolate reductase(NADPH)